MWLLKTSRAELHFVVSPESVPDPGFAILSHVWGDDEQSFQDLQALRERCRASGESPRDLVSAKIRQCCELAEAQGFEWVWIDTCCIDKTSSAELSEAINSMYRYYALSAVCFAYLADVPPAPDAWRGILGGSLFNCSKWHRRGWTLQELLAPSTVFFLSASWTALGSRNDLAAELEAATRVPASLMRLEAQLSDFSVAQRMSWAASRVTTRPEDEAYCLLGIFGINLPTLYGEGGNAFQRLQEEIMRQSPDTTLFAWGEVGSYAGMRTCDDLHEYPFLAQSPSDFRDSCDIAYNSPCFMKSSSGASNHGRPSFRLTAYGVSAHVSLTSLRGGFTLLDLSWSWCSSEVSQAKPVFLILIRLPQTVSPDDARLYAVGGTWIHRKRLVVDVSQEFVSSTETTQIYLLRRDPRLGPIQLVSRYPQRPYPCNRSLHAPFHFHVHDRVHRRYNVDVEWTGTPPAVLELVVNPPWLRHRILRVYFGLCSGSSAAWLSPDTNSAALSKETVHWACLDGCLDRAVQDEHHSSHVCSDDHIARWPGNRKVLSVDCPEVDRLTNSPRTVTYLVELVFVRSVLNQHTMILRSIEVEWRVHRLEL